MASLTTSQLVLDIPQQPPAEALDLEVTAGQRWGILGANGIGKTTLLHTLGGLKAPRSGTVLLDHTPLSQWPRKALARRLGVLFQQPAAVIESSVEESALAGLYPRLSGWQRRTREHRLRVSQSLTQLGLAELAARRVSALSGGERQRLEIATLLVQAPDLWLVDEPTNHLDLNHQQGVMHLLAHQADAGSAIVMTLHDINLAVRWCSHLLLLFPDGQRQWGRCEDMAHTALLENVYQQPLVRTEVKGYPVFIADDGADTSGVSQ